MNTAPKPIRNIPGTVDIIDQRTGKVERREGMSWALVPPPAEACQICGVEHEPRLPHNAQSLYYQACFSGMHGRAATWADAMAHCTVEMQAAWERELRALGRWTEPPAGEDPIAHHGID